MRRRLRSNAPRFVHRNASSSTAALLPDRRGAYFHSGDYLWQPDGISLPASPTPWMARHGFAGGSTLDFTKVRRCKLLVWHHGISNSRATAVTNSATNAQGVIPFVKALITAGTIDPCAVLFMQGMDPADASEVDLWGNDAPDGAYPFKSRAIEQINWIAQIAPVSPDPADRAIAGFSRGCHVAMCQAAEYGTLLAARYVGFGGPRMVGDWPDENTYWGNFAADEKARCFADSQAAALARAPISSNGKGLFNAHSANRPALRVVRSAGDATTNNPMTQFITRLTALGVTHTAVNLGTATHAIGGTTGYLTVDAGASLAWALPKET